ncbi:MAG: nitroreductase family protein [Kiritimatiellae bacterium]|nr:nitroreductase family protein [Kiritimatiellia bacterium]MDD5521957.1 nitroreductase family protein [Kiritimatiellia bacterium]
MLNFSVDDELCTRCGWCALDCPAQIIEQTDKNLPSIKPDKEVNCIQCQHCLAICPTAALSIHGKNPHDSMLLSAERIPRLEQMIRLIRGRRSIRHYKDENVDQDLIRRLLATLANAPSGCNCRKLTFRVIDDKVVMYRLREKVMAELKTASTSNRIPESFAFLTNAIPAYYEHGTDMIFRAAPHALIISAPSDIPCPNEDVILALAYFELLAQSAGLGTVWWGMLKMTLETLPELKPLLGLPADHVYYGMLFGVPDVHFTRTVQHDDTAKIVKIKVTD